MGQLKIRLLRFACRILLPNGVCVCKTSGLYTKTVEIIFAEIDTRGVLQGISDVEAESRF